MSRPIHIEILYFAGCPNFAPALENVRAVVTRLGLEARIETVEVRDQAHAIELEFPGSPTVRVNGVDLEPGVELPVAFGCRRYGEGGIPSLALIEHALQTEET